MWKFLNKNPLFTSLKGKGREVNCLFPSYSTSQRRGKVVWKYKLLFMLKNDEGVFPNVDFGFAKTYVT